MNKIYNSILVLAVILLLPSITNAQDENNKWVFGVSANAVNLFSGGEDAAPLGEIFDEYFNLNDHWNIGFPQVSVGRYLGAGFSINATASANEISKWGEFGEADESVLVDNLKYYGLDGMLSYNFSKVLNSEKFAPFIGVGGGYTWIEEGAFNTFSNAAGIDNLVGAGTVNGTLGFQYWFTDIVGLNVQTTYKHVFEDYLPAHWQHSMGVVVKLGASKDKIDTTDTDEDGVPDTYDLCPNVAGKVELAGCPDSDGDGVADKDDLCPNVAGLATYGGCADSDNDGFADNVDDCPNEYGTNKGCKTQLVDNASTDASPTVKTVEVAKPFSGKKKVFFAFNSAKLDNNIKEILDDIIDRNKEASYTIAVDGYTDNIGSDSYNQNLSQKRAQAVKDYLTSKGVPASAVTTVAKGENNPLASNNTNAGRAENRRAELIIEVKK